MPFVTFIVPEIPADHEERFTAELEKSGPEIKALPSVLGVAYGPIVANDGKPITEFKYIQIIGNIPFHHHHRLKTQLIPISAFATKEDHGKFFNSDYFQGKSKSIQKKGIPVPRTVLFDLVDFPKVPVTTQFVRFTYVTVSDESKLPAARDAHGEVMTAIGHERYSGKSVDSPEIISLGVCGFDTLGEALAAFETPAAKATFEKYKALGEFKDVVVKRTIV